MTINSAPTPSIFDTQSLSALKGNIRNDDPKALRAASQQFEAVFLQMVMKSMRAAAPQSGFFDSEQTRFYQELLDSQMAQVMAARGGVGLGHIIERQLSRPDVSVPDGESGGIPLLLDERAYPLVQPAQALPQPINDQQQIPLENAPVRPAQTPSTSQPRGLDAVRPAPTPAANSSNSQADNFVQALWPAAVDASRQTGIPPQFMLAQAALESGWGRHEPHLADGQPSYNLFGIKAGSNWNGPVVELRTTEYIGGRAVQRVERFRAYASYAEAFNDYSRLLTKQPRYAALIGEKNPVAFARGLQNAGYATDPSYADKLLRVIGSRVIASAGSGSLA